MEAMIKRVENGYVLTLAVIGGPTEEYVFQRNELCKAIQKIEEFFLECSEREEGK